MNVSNENLFGDLHVAVTLRKLIPFGFGILRDMRRFVSLVHLLEDKVVCSIVFASDHYRAALFVEAHLNLASR